MNTPGPQFLTFGARLATDNTNLFFSTYIHGLYRASLDDRIFTPLPTTGIPLWTNGCPTNLLAITDIAATPQGTIVIAGSPFNVISNVFTFNPPGGPANTLPVFYWWDESNQLWQPAIISGKTYPYIGNVCNFSIAPDGSLWTGSGFYPYVYRSTDGGRSYTAFDINARVPTNYFPMALTGFNTFGEIFSVRAGWNNEVVIGTETGGYLHTTNNGVTWTSLDPNFTDPNSVNPLGRTGDARVGGQDRYGNFICGNFLNVASPAQNIWGDVPLIGWRPRDGAIFNASSGLATNVGSGEVVTPASGASYIFLAQNYLLLGGVYRQMDGHHWSQFNDGNGLDFPFAPGLTNALGPGDCIVAVSNTIFIGASGAIYSFDSTPPPITNRPPVAEPQNVTLFLNAPTNLTLSGHDADGDSLNFSLVALPQHGQITGTPPDVTYTPSNNFTGLDFFTFVADDSRATSAPVVVNFAINALTNTLSTVALISPANGSVFLAPTNLTLAASATDPDGVRSVNFYNGNNLVGIATNQPFAITLTNVATGDYAFSARAIDNHGARTWSSPVLVTVEAIAPRMNIERADLETVSLTWPLELDGFFLETAPEPTGPWTLSPFPPQFFPSGQTATIPATNQQFFRLMRPF